MEKEQDNPLLGIQFDKRGSKKVICLLNFLPSNATPHIIRSSDYYIIAVKHAIETN